MPCPGDPHSAERALVAPMAGKHAFPGLMEKNVDLQTGDSPRPCHRGPEAAALGCVTAKGKLPQARRLPAAPRLPVRTAPSCLTLSHQPYIIRAHFAEGETEAE